MPLFDDVANSETGEIQSAEWEKCVREHRPVGVCQDCRADLFGEHRQVDFKRVYRGTQCTAGHERVIPGHVFKGRVVPRQAPLFPEHYLHDHQDD